MTRKRGSLAVVGTGIEAMGQMTPAARTEIENADSVFYVVSDPLTPKALAELNPSAQSLDGLYAVGKHRLRSYAAMVERVLRDVRRGLRVCFVLYGHPGVFALPAHAAVRLARAEGFRAKMLPAVSADACLIADLGIDPSAGLQTYEATDFLVRRRSVDPAVGLVLWQVGVVGRFDLPAGGVDRQKLRVLVEVLSEIYPRGHRGILYEASVLPGFDPAIETVALRRLHLANVTSASTLYVPPAMRAEIDPAMMRRLGIADAERIHCLRSPPAQDVRLAR
jgi:hypothetical protein